MEQQETQYRNKIVYLSFILSLLIIIRHSIGLKIYDLSGPLLYVETFFSYATDLVVPMFFAMSGYLFYQNFDFGKLRSKWKTRTHSLFIPFAVWNIIGFLFAWLLFNLPYVSASLSRSLPEYNIGSWVYDVFIDTRYNITWFIRDLIIFVVVTPLFFPALKHRMGGAILIAIILVISFVIGNKFVSKYAAVFLFGGYMGIHYKEFCQQRYNEKQMITCGFLLLISVIIEASIGSPQHGVMVPLRLLQIPLIWVASDFLAIKTEPKWWMKISFFIYCSHSMILESIEKVFWLGLGNTFIGALLDFMLAPLLTLLIITALAWCLKKNKMVWGILSGGRA